MEDKENETPIQQEQQPIVDDNKKDETKQLQNLTFLNDPTIYKCFDFSDRFFTRLKNVFTFNKLSNFNERLSKIRADMVEYDFESFNDLLPTIRVLQTCLLDFDTYVTYPFIKIHVVDLQTGKLFNEYKFNKENEDENKTSYTTQIFDLFSKRDSIAAWNEEIDVLFEESFEYNENILILFELIDNTPIEKDTEKRNIKLDFIKKKVAWGYLLPFGAYTARTGLLDIQFYKYKFRESRYIENSIYKDIPSVYFDFLWLNKQRVNASLSINISFKEKEKTLKKQEGNQMEKSMIANYETKNLFETRAKFDLEINNKRRQQRQEVLDKLIYKDYEGSILPKKLFKNLSTDYLGSTVSKFSLDGRFLAYSTSKENRFSYVKVYDFEDDVHYCNLYNHNEIINAVDWHKEEAFLLSCSSDKTMKLFILPDSSEETELTDIIQMKRHMVCEIIETSQIVFCCFFYIEDNEGVFVLSSNIEGKISLYTVDPYQQQVYKKLIEIDINLETEKKYSSHIVTFDNKLVISDSLGELNLFEYILEENKLRVEKIGQISIKELKGKHISYFNYLQQENYILVQTKDSTMRLINLKNNKVVNRYLNGQFENYNIKGCVSTDGQIIVSGCENSKLLAWDLYCMDYIEFDGETDFKGILMCVDWNPVYNVLAVSSFGSNFPVRVLIGETS